MVTNDELRSFVRHSLRLAIAHREEADALRTRDEAFARRGQLRRYEEDCIRAARSDRQVLADRRADPGPELLELWERAGLDPFEPAEARAP